MIPNTGLDSAQQQQISSSAGAGVHEKRLEASGILAAGTALHAGPSRRCAGDARPTGDQGNGADPAVDAKVTRMDFAGLNDHASNADAADPGRHGRTALRSAGAGAITKPTRSCWASVHGLKW